MSIWFDGNATLRGNVFNIEVEGIWCKAKFDMPGIINSGEIFFKKRASLALGSFINDNVNWFDIAFTFRMKDNYVSLIMGYSKKIDNCIIVPNENAPLLPVALSFIYPDRTEIIAIDDLPVRDLVYCKIVIQSIIFRILQELV